MKIEPMRIVPKYDGDAAYRTVRLVVVVAVITSAPWAWMIHDERERAAALLAEKVAQQMKVSHVVIKFSNGVTDKLTTGAK